MYVRGEVIEGVYAGQPVYKRSNKNQVPGYIASGPRNDKVPVVENEPPKQEEEEEQNDSNLGSSLILGVGAFLLASKK